MGKIINLLDTIAAWFTGKADELEKLDVKYKAIINAQNRRIFWAGFICGATPFLLAGIFVMSK